MPGTPGSGIFHRNQPQNTPESNSINTKTYTTKNETITPNHTNSHPRRKISQNTHQQTPTHNNTNPPYHPMRLAGLLSGGKDSVYAAHHAQETGHTLTHLVSLRSKNPDSYMFHTVNIDITKLQAEAWNIPYVEAETQGIKEEELQDLKTALTTLDIDGVITGAIASKYQAQRIDRLCNELNLHHYHPIWGADRETLLQKMLDTGMKIIFTAVAAHGLTQDWLGKPLTPQRINQLKTLHQKYSVDMAGEGGEYESLVIDAPWFKKRIKIVTSEKTWDGVSGRFNILSAHLVGKNTNI